LLIIDLGCGTVQRTASADEKILVLQQKISDAESKIPGLEDKLRRTRYIHTEEAAQKKLDNQNAKIALLKTELDTARLKGSGRLEPLSPNPHPSGSSPPRIESQQTPNSNNMLGLDLGVPSTAQQESTYSSLLSSTADRVSHGSSPHLSLLHQTPLLTSRTHGHLTLSSGNDFVSHYPTPLSMSSPRYLYQGQSASSSLSQLQRTQPLPSEASYPYSEAMRSYGNPATNQVSRPPTLQTSKSMYELHQSSYTTSTLPQSAPMHYHSSLLPRMEWEEPPLPISTSIPQTESNTRSIDNHSYSASSSSFNLSELQPSSSLNYSVNSSSSSIYPSSYLLESTIAPYSMTYSATRLIGQ
jgi:hypothetical protein